MLPGFTATASLSRSSGHYSQMGAWAGGAARVRPAQIIHIDPCVLGIPNIIVGWQPYHDGRNGVVIVTGHSFAGNTVVRLRFDNCTSAFPELGFATTDACGNFTIWHQCMCSGPPIAVHATDSSAHSADGTVRQTC
jgi:hypothetical protein